MYSGLIEYLSKPYSIPIFFTALILFIFTGTMLVVSLQFFLGSLTALNSEMGIYGSSATMASVVNLVLSLCSLHFGRKYFFGGIENVLHGFIWWVIVAIQLGGRVLFSPEILNQTQVHIVFMIIAAAILIAIALMHRREVRH